MEGFIGGKWMQIGKLAVFGISGNTLYMHMFGFAGQMGFDAQKLGFNGFKKQN